MINFLQLSDIHHIYTDEEDNDDRQIHIALLDDLKRYNSEGNSIDYILICGDIANSCDSNQYKLASKFIDEICDIVKCKPHDVYVVPGNHDKDRSCDHARTRELIYKELRGGDGDSYFKEIKDNEPQILKLLYSPLSNYYKFAFDYNCCDSVALQCIFTDRLNDITITHSDKIYWCDIIPQVGKIFKLNIYGINSVFTSDENDKNSPLFLPQRAYNISKSVYDINILMMHHPLTEENIINYESIEKKIDEKFQIQLYGHEHKQSSNFGNGIKIYSGALNPHGEYDDEYRPSYNIIGVNFTEESNVKCVVSGSISSYKWDHSRFCKDEKESKKFEINIDNSDDAQQPIVSTENHMNNNSDINMKALQYKFLKLDDRRSIIDKFAPETYDEDCSEQINCINFLKYIISDNEKQIELWNLINK